MPMWVRELISQLYVSHSVLETGLKHFPSTAPRDNGQKDRQSKAKRMRRISKEATKEGATSPRKYEPARKADLGQRALLGVWGLLQGWAKGRSAQEK